MSLDERRQTILSAVVRDYVDTARPVGSEDLASRHALGIKSATIRNVLADLSDRGYLRQPHTSAGRVPSDRGYRFYVDHLMVAREVDTPDVTDETTRSYELDMLLRQTCALLTRATSYTSVATPPRPADTQVSQVFASPLGDARMLLIVVFSTGQVENRLLVQPPEISAVALIGIVNALNAAFAGRTLQDIGSEELGPESPAEFSPDIRALFATLSEALRLAVKSAAEEDTVFLEGASEILRQPEFRDVAKLESVLSTLQKGRMIFQTLSRAFLGPDVTVVIGTENHVEAMHECSVVTAPYYVGTRERGTIGVVGPTRMDYDRAVPAVGFFARSLTQTLTFLQQ